MSFWGELYRRTEQRSDVETDSEVAAVLRALESLPLRAKVLDVGAGDGRHIRALRGQGRNVIGVDFDETVTNGDVVRGDMRALPFADSHFDAAYSLRNSAFGFNEAELATVWAEMTRVVRPDGLIFAAQTRADWAAQVFTEPKATTICGITEQCLYYRGLLLVRREVGSLWGDLCVRLFEVDEWEPWLKRFGLELVEIAETETDTQVLAKRTLTQSGN